MTQFLIRLFEAPALDFHRHIAAMESKFGARSVDIQLTNRINVDSKTILPHLSLEADTLPKELYHSLNQYLSQENNLIETTLGLTQENLPEQVVKTIVDFVHSNKMLRPSFFAKPAKLKSFIKKHPPKKVMKMLGYRSVDSLMKREASGFIISLARDIEGSDWQKEYLKFCSNFIGSDCSIQDIHVSIISARTRKHLDADKVDLSYLVRMSPESGSLSLVPPANRFKNDTITYAMAILDGIYQLRLQGNYYNYISFGKDFGKKYAKALFGGIRSGTGDENSIMWPALYKQVARTELDEPLIIDDVIEKPAQLIMKHFKLTLPWDRFDDVVYGDKDLVSLNLMDVVTNSSNNFYFDQRYIHSAQQEIWDKLSYEFLKSSV